MKNRTQPNDENQRTLAEGRQGNAARAERSGGGDVAVWQPGNEAGVQTDLPARWNTQAPHLTALEALEQFGWSVFPLDPEKKPPKTDGKHPNGTPKRLSWKPYQARRAAHAEVMNWHKRYHPSAYAVITGHISGILILDFDGDVGKATLASLGLHPHVQTGSGGYHVYFRHPGWRVPTLNSTSKRVLGHAWPGLDIRADGGYGAFCGRNANGRYRWLRDPVPEEISLLPEALRDFLGLLRAPASEGVQADHNEASGKTPQGAARGPRNFRETLIDRALGRIGPAMGRNDAGFWLACQLRDNGYASAEGEVALLDYARRVPRWMGKASTTPIRRKRP